MAHRPVARGRTMKSVTSRFVMLMATAAVAPLLLYGIISIRSLLGATRESVLDGHLNVARTAAAQVHRYLTTSAKILQAVGADLDRTDLEPWQQERILKNYVIGFPEFREITLFDSARRPVVSSRVGAPRVGVPDGATAGPEGLLITPFELDDDLLPSTTLAARVTHLGLDRGWLVAELNLTEMWRMVDRIRIGEEGFALIVSDEGRLIAHGRPEGKRRIARGETLSGPLVSLVRQASGGGDVARELEEPAGGPMLVAAAPIAPLGWTLVVEQPTAEAYAPARRLVRQLFVAIGLGLVATLTVGSLWGRSFLQPIFALIRGTRALADGRLDERVRVGGGGRELEQLGAAFNGMADRLLELQEDVRKQERQAVFGRIAVGLVHDLSHPIQNVANSCRLIVKMRDDADYRQTFQRTVDREFSAIRRVLEGLRHLARPLPLERFPVDVNKSIADVVEAMQSHGEVAGVAIEARLAPEAPTVQGDLFALGRVYRNLIVNALQATAPGGRILISIAVDAGRVRISVADTGCGIPADRLAAIFEDFATTKRRGLGLGLAICRKIVEQLRGSITVTSDVGRGSTFVLDFPQADPASVARPPTGEVAPAEQVEA
jgi:signal transduction histidine kinase